MRKIYWNKLAQSDYFQIIDYLIAEWGVKPAQDFIDQVEKVELILSKGNIDFESTNRQNIRRLVLSKHITLFYKIFENKSVELLRFWNNYQKINKLKL
jgi:plasmid stabilization system protein ParE